ncbi:uncharacterized protein DUF695 [Paractinoplanes brasiliensis]|uniref:Uncharacterized protein DUF695 n=2 Tax=Paractinoplanes brasiliensis TaxID=52695 RepID=A0A4R6JQG9_9ACTN|nr:uncharacterized protein DUF695 [Actinoplanes brasiliensis]GID32188.1 hypothetical protein Abr02nite_71710 [Actinoplanes brasiliensis]
MVLKLFRRKPKPEAETIAEFWQWWASARDDVARTAGAGRVTHAVQDVACRARVVDADLDCHIVPGTTSAYVLIVTPNWPDTCRGVAERWLAAAPEPDETWSYRCVRVVAELAAFESSREFRGHTFDLTAVRFGLTAKEEGRLSDVVVHHPAFSSLPDKVQEDVAYNLIELALGEDDVDIWIDDITWSGVEPADPRTPVELSEAVRARAESFDHWEHRRTEWGGAAALVTAAPPLRSVRWPRFDLYVAVRLPYQQYDSENLPLGESSAALTQFTDGLCAAVEGDGVMVAHTTFKGERTLHFYVDAESGARAELESRLPQWNEGVASSHVQLDQGFAEVADLELR